MKSWNRQVDWVWNLKSCSFSCVSAAFLEALWNYKVSDRFESRLELVSLFDLNLLVLNRRYTITRNTSTPIIPPTSTTSLYSHTHSTFLQSFAPSQAAPTFKHNKSSNFLPTICMPTGSLTFSSSFAGAKPTGIVSAGCPVLLYGAVL